MGHALRRSLWLALPGVIGATGLALFLEPRDVVRFVCFSLLGPYLLGASKLYEARALRGNQRALQVLAPAALRAAYRAIPELLREGGGADGLREAVRQELSGLPREDWGGIDRDAFLEGSGFEALVEQAVGDMRSSFDPFALLEHNEALEARSGGDTLTQSPS